MKESLSAVPRAGAPTAPAAPAYGFPPPPRAGAQEWRGTPVGVDNCVTRTRGRTPRADKVLDADPVRRDALLEAAEAAFRAAPASRRRTHDVVIHGVRVRAHTTSPHHIDFWRENWFSVAEWRAATGRPAPRRPSVTVYALSEVATQPEGAHYSHERGVIVFFNTSYYGQLKSWVLGAVGRVLASEWGIHSIHGACAQAGEGKAVLFIAPTGTGKSTSSYGLMGETGARFHSDDWVYVRYAWRLGGSWWSPLSVSLDGVEVARGYHCIDWLRSHPASPQAVVEMRGLDDRRRRVRASRLPLDERLNAFAYISERRFYLRTNIVESYPGALPALLASKLENVPDVSQAFIAGRRDFLEELASEVGGSAELTTIARLLAFDNARAMLDPVRVFGHRVVTDPLEPVALSHAVLLERDPRRDVLAERLSLPRWMSRLLVGLTPDGKREIAYNAYRAVDDGAEQRYLEGLGGSGADRLYDTYASRDDHPPSLDEEFTLMALLHEASATYSVNTVMKRLPGVASVKEAVGATLRLLRGIIQRTPSGSVGDAEVEAWMAP